MCCAAVYRESNFVKLEFLIRTLRNVEYAQLSNDGNKREVKVTYT